MPKKIFIMPLMHVLLLRPASAGAAPFVRPLSYHQNSRIFNIGVRIFCFGFSIPLSGVRRLPCGAQLTCLRTRLSPRKF